MKKRVLMNLFFLILISPIYSQEIPNPGFENWDGATGVESIDGNPNSYALLQNYPNPFNPLTKIEYSIPEASFVQIRVYDILGNEVASLVNQAQRAGVHRTDFSGSDLASGLYIAQLTAGNFVQTIKMSLLK